MRRPVCRILVFVCGLIAPHGFAQPSLPPTLAKVKVRTVVRGTPGEHSPETGTLEPGTYVTVVAAEGNDWLAIQPPNGSISWVRWLMVEPQGQPGADGTLKPPFNAIVRADKSAPTMLRAGAAGSNKPLDVERHKLPEGTIVRVIGPKVKARIDAEDDTSWYPIVAPADDYRYIRRDAVEWSGTPVTNSFVVKTGDTSFKPLPGPSPTETPVRKEGDWTLSVPNGTDPRPLSPKRDDWPNYHPTFREAEKARGNGDHATAEKLYRQVAEDVSREGSSKDIDLANLCYDRIFLMKRGNNTNSGNWDGTSAWKPSERTAERTPLTQTPRAERKAPEAAGILKPTRFEINRRLVYVLTDNRGTVTNYVTSGGVDLDKYTNKWVTVRGEESKPVELRGYSLLSVTQIVDAR
jgi:hypothetical protein